jgi:prepilin-type N-terminal cleavage/methylation domain-containing protein
VRNENPGFTLLELICAISIVMVFAGLVVPSGRRWIRTAQEARERSQAESLWEAMQMYTLEEYPQKELRSYLLLEILCEEPISSSGNPLNGYLSGTIEDSLALQSVTICTDTNEISEMSYRTDEWIVTVSGNEINLSPR